MGEFVRVARVDEVPPGQGKLVEAGGRYIALFNVDGQYYAIDDECTHAAASLSEGFVEGTVVECPLHGGQFDLRTGEAVWSPAVIPVATYAVRVEGDEIWVDPEPRPPGHGG
ncbi:MAG TPA: bifunctional 3-phenylpropionate/cinnamic acid dioxygenase ferredoxin subunit [Chloroflexota bacterium]|jgi:nitrite reductase/ring-hydroxylating ferredoxin subunit|nr:bifunctional 3-phenylpropionate/cinnamic acid dioxygenase ferredoxin subunit [Chloroflexota bacterium]